MAASNLTLRFATAVVMIPLLLALLYLGPAWGWFVFLLVATVVGAFELFGMTHAGDRVAGGVGVALTWAVMAAMWFHDREPRLAMTLVLALPLGALLLALARLGEVRTAALRMAATVFGPLWLGGGLGSLALLRVAGGHDGATYVVFSLLLAWLSDTGAYFAGRAFGKHKLYEAVSPKKTVEGAVGGVVATVAGTYALRYLLLPALPLLDAAVLAVLGSVLGMVGDLGESLLKRSVGVKDSGGIVPGHGGILDRIDAVVVTAPLLLLYLAWAT